MALGTWADIFKPEQIESMEDVARASFPKKAPSEFSAEQIDALNQDPKLLEQYNKGLENTAPKIHTPEISVPSNTKVETGFQLGESKNLSEPIDVSSQRLRNAMERQRGVPVGESSSVSPSAEERIKSFMSKKSSLPTSELGSAETAALEQAGKVGSMESTIQKLSGLSDEALSKMGSLGQKILSSRLVSKGLPAVGAIGEGFAAKSNLEKGNIPEVAGNLMGAGSNLAMLAGSGAAALPLGLGAATISAGSEYAHNPKMAQMLKMSKEGYNPGSDTELAQELSSQNIQGNNPTDLLAVNAAKYSDQFGGSTPAPQVPSTSQELESLKSQYAPESESPSSHTPIGAAPSAKSPGGPSPASVSPQALSADEGFTNNTVANLQKAQDEANRRKNMADLAEGAAMTRSGVLGLQGNVASPDITAQLKMSESDKKSADEGVDQFKARGEQEKNDPKSAASTQARKLASTMLKQAGMNINIPDNISANDLEKRFPQLQHMATSKATLDARKESAAQHKEVMDLAKSDKRNLKEETEFGKFSRALPNIGGQPANVLRNRKNQAVTIFNTFGIDPNLSEKEIEALPNEGLDNVGRLMITESSIELNKLLAGAGTSSQRTLEKIIPHNILMDKTKLEDYWTNKMNPAKQAAFAKAILKISSRVKDSSTKELNAIGQKYLSGTERFSKNPNISADYERQLEAYDFQSPEKYQEQQKELKSAPVKTAQPSDTVRVKDTKTGKVGSIPRSRLNAALSSGKYEEVK